ncbi:MAG TPA: hypothetical protein VN181_03980, partial [Thermoanaerobaculia bacterium]|nr:hypothetical protein [Thermoanaerobaculia bacterium]
MLLLIATATGATAAARVTPEEAAYQDALSSGDLAVRQTKLASALQRFASSDSDWVWKMRILFAQTLIPRGNPQKAIEVLSRKPPARLPDLQVTRLIELGVAHGRLSHDEQADAFLAQACALARELESRELARALRMRGQFAPEKKRLAYLEEGIVSARKLGNRQEENALLAAKALQLTKEGRYGEAITIGEEAIRVALANNYLGLANAEGNLGWA